ncbi:MAG: insulinase family protein, partial [Lactococcus lactis]|nr:insulinase family protein [Lactococcus lactis]
MNNTLTIGFKLTLYLALISIQYGCAFNSEVLKDTVSTDSSIVHQEFSNGFKYYLKPMASETDELTLQFIVKAGLNQEASDQYTLSHFMEHIALTSGKHESMNVLYGTNRARELNLDRTSIMAYTGRDHTTFIIKIDNTAKAKKFAFRLLKDIMNDLQIKDSYVDSERIPFLDESEFRGGESSLVRQDFILDSKILGVKHIPPKDYPTFIYNFDKEKLIRFYNDWYRPDLMGLSITGSIKDISGLQKELRHWFATVPKAKTANPKTNVNNNYLELPQRYIKRIRPALYKDKYATEVRYRLYFRNYKKPNSSKEEKLIRKLKQDLLKNILNTQYKQISEENGWPFVLAIDYP